LFFVVFKSKFVISCTITQDLSWNLEIIILDNIMICQVWLQLQQQR